MRVIVRESAYRDLDNIRDWIAKDRPIVADRVIERIVQSTELLGNFRTSARREGARHPGMGSAWIALYRRLHR
jgi:plasmid stabilization system protein ParE